MWGRIKDKVTWKCDPGHLQKCSFGLVPVDESTDACAVLHCDRACAVAFLKSMVAVLLEPPPSRKKMSSSLSPVELPIARVTDTLATDHW